MPTVFGNVLVGVALAGADVVWWRVALAFVSVALLYYGGMALNDVVDAPIDARQRSKRPIPSGRISRRTAAFVACFCLVWGLVVAAAMGFGAGVVGLALVGCIVGYDVLHKRHAWAVVLMGACRGLVYPLAAAIAGGELAWGMAWVGGAVLAYTVGLTVIARSEHLEGRGRPGSASRATWEMAAWGLPLVPVVGVLGVPIENKGLGVIGLVVLIGWGVWAAMLVNRVRPRTKQAVMAWLAGFCLIDAFYLGLMDRGGLMVFALVLFGVTVVGHRVVKGT